jgi:Rad3-related DNA helicase
MDRCFSLSVLDPEAIATIAQEYRICPFNLSLAMIPWVDIIVADYNYVFDPLVAQAHFKELGKQAVLLVDEAHNLIDRSRQMYSAEWDESLALKVIDGLPQTSDLSRNVNGVVESLMRLEHELNNTYWLPVSSTSTLLQLAEKVRVIAVLLMERSEESELTVVEQELLKQSIKLALILELIIEMSVFDNYACFLIRSPNQLLEAYRIKLSALNAAPFLRMIYLRFHSYILFSATLSPESYIRNTLGCVSHEQNCRSLEVDRSSVDYVQLPSPFLPEQQGVFISQVIDTRYRYREHYIDVIADAIHAVYQAKAGNYLACFSSYQFMRQIVEAYRLRYGDEHIRIQSSNESNAQREAFIEAFFTQSNLLGFVILGGSYTEGIDFKGDALHGVIIVGTGLPQMNSEQDAIKQCFDRQKSNGFDMAYRFPGLQRVLQSAGRVVRSENDKGVIVLLDKRFLSQEYSDYLPSIWPTKPFDSLESLARQLANFWHL